MLLQQFSPTGLIPTDHRLFRFPAASCCPIHTGTVFTYFREEEEPRDVFDEDDLEGTDDEGVNIAIHAGEVYNKNDDDIDDKEMDPDVDANDIAIQQNLGGDDEQVLAVEAERGNNKAEEVSPDVAVDGAEIFVIDQVALVADASDNLKEGQDKSEAETETEAEAGERGGDIFVDEYDEEEDETIDIDIDYDELNLPNLNKELSHVQVCRSCHYCYCAKCSYQHQCHRCG